MDEGVSVVIPTYRRARLLGRAIRSAVAQTHAPREVIVVGDGPDEETSRAIESMGEAVDGVALRYQVLDARRGGCAARNAGIEAARGEWIALLDDDDEWYPEKLERQMAVARVSTAKYPIVACRAHVSRGIRDVTWPSRRPHEDEDVSEYLFCRKGLGQGDGIFITSMLLAKRELLLAVPFDVKVRRHQDSDWILRAARTEGAMLEWAWEALMTFHLEVGKKAQGESSVSRSGDPVPSMEWGRSAVDNGTMSRRAYAYFLATQVAPRMRLSRHSALVPELLREFLGRSDVSMHPLGLLLVYLLTAQGFRNAVIARLRSEPRVTG